MLRAIACPVILAALVGCTTVPRPAIGPLAAAERVIEAFYSFDRARLTEALADAPRAHPRILYYQGWAEGGHYTVLDRERCGFENATSIACSIKVRDDLIGALGTGYDVTDTFHFAVASGRIVGVTNTSDDPPEFEHALDWVKANRPETMAGPCRGFFKGGPTPGDCVRAVVAGFREFGDR